MTGESGAGDGPDKNAARVRFRRPGRVATLAAVGTTVATVLPVFLVGGLSVQLGQDTGLGPAMLGVVVAVYWASSAIFSSTAGRVSARVGSRAGMVAAALLGALALAGIALFTPTWPWLCVWLVLAGAANAVGHPPSNALIAARVSRRNRALAFGLKQAAIPLATLSAGLAVPLLALTLGWRWSFAIAAAFALVMVVVVLAVVSPTKRPATDRRTAGGRIPRSLLPFLLLASVASGLGSGQANVIGAFTVSAASLSGFSAASAGLLLSLGSVAGIAARPLAGLAADRRIGGTMATVAMMLGVGAVGIIGMAIGLPWTFAIGCILAFGLGWGWNGLVHFVVTDVSQPYGAQATGLVQVGAYIGSAVGPFVFGFIFDRFGPSIGWSCAAVVAVLAAIVALLAHRIRPHDHLLERTAP